MLKIEHLTKQFGDFKAVDDLSLEVKSGQICAFIGHNGAGKTTTLKSISGIIPFESGEIYVDGESVKKIQSKQKLILDICLMTPLSMSISRRLTISILLLIFMEFRQKIGKKELKVMRKGSTYMANLAISFQLFHME